MKTALLAAMGGILMMFAVNNHADAHQINNARRPHLRDFLAVSPDPAAPTVVPYSLRLPAPADRGSATGGPVGGPNQS